jgi:hypothetical protein
MYFSTAAACALAAWHLYAISGYHLPLGLLLGRGRRRTTLPSLL